METFEQHPQEWTALPPDRPSRPSLGWLLFATILGALIGGAVVYFGIDTSPEATTAAGPAETVEATTTVAPIDTTSPGATGSALDIAYQTVYPVEGSTTGYISVVDGFGEELMPDTGAMLTVNVVSAVATDLDNDGVDDAVVVLVTTSGGTGHFYSVHGVFADPDQTVVTNAVFLGDRISITEIGPDATGRVITVRYGDHSDQVGYADLADLQVIADIELFRSGAQMVARGSILTADAAEPKLTSAATVTTGGLGPVRVGMTVDEATKAAGVALIAPVDGSPEASPGCGFATIDGFDGVGFMLLDGIIGRIDVWSGSTATASGARIGSTEQEIKDLFPDLIEVSDHAYVDGNYLTLVPTAENLKDVRVVFETDGSVVTGYRAGKTPQVEWIEGCA